MAGTQPGFCSMKQLTDSIATPPGWDANLDANPSLGYPKQYVTGMHFRHLVGERQCGVKFLVKGKNTMAGTGHRTTDLHI